MQHAVGGAADRADDVDRQRVGTAAGDVEQLRRARRGDADGGDGAGLAGVGGVALVRPAAADAGQHPQRPCRALPADFRHVAVQRQAAVGTADGADHGAVGDADAHGAGRQRRHLERAGQRPLQTSAERPVASPRLASNTSLPSAAAASWRRPRLPVSPATANGASKPAGPPSAPSQEPVAAPQHQHAGGVGAQGGDDLESRAGHAQRLVLGGGDQRLGAVEEPGDVVDAHPAAAGCAYQHAQLLQLVARQLGHAGVELGGLHVRQVQASVAAHADVCRVEPAILRQRQRGGGEAPAPVADADVRRPLGGLIHDRRHGPAAAREQAVAGVVVASALRLRPADAGREHRSVQPLAASGADVGQDGAGAGRCGQRLEAHRRAPAVTASAGLDDHRLRWRRVRFGRGEQRDERGEHAETSRMDRMPAADHGRRPPPSNAEDYGAPVTRRRQGGARGPRPRSMGPPGFEPGHDGL